ncbi:MAG: amylo-alpha-1,6-glucosidase [Phycisphaerae bacterium]|nr:amylo-alpha-1,6-glucosidase [Phycisphaerae bacterium]
MNRDDKKLIEEAKAAALKVLLYNAHGPYYGLPRTAGWGYPEPYTRDLMICLLGVLVSEDQKLIGRYKKVLETLAKNRSPNGHIPSLVHDREDRGASDCTPLFLMGVGLYRKATGQTDFLKDAVQESLTWMRYQSPSDRVIVAQLPTTDWRDEQWVLGYGLFVNTIVYTYLRLLGQHQNAEIVKDEMEHFAITGQQQHRHVHEGLLLRKKPYYALWSFKVYKSERFDLLGNSLAILSGIASPTRAKSMVSWIEKECKHLREKGLLGIDLPPNFFPYIQPHDPDWRPRYEIYNQPGQYHNGGIWPYICGFYVAALVAARKKRLARKKLVELAKLNRLWRAEKAEFGFNEWLHAEDGRPMGQDWQSWSAAMYLYAAACVEQNRTPFFEDIRSISHEVDSE